LRKLDLEERLEPLPQRLDEGEVRTVRRQMAHKPIPFLALNPKKP
jgi:hypothetical protein